MIVNITQSKNMVDISYINERGSISILRKKGVKYWRYEKNPNGDYKTWDGSRASKVTQGVNKFGMYEIRQFLYTLPKTEQDLIFGYNLPKVWACDIEVDITKITDPFPDPLEAKAPINLITITTDTLDTVVLALEDDHRKFELDEGYKKQETERLRHRIEKRICDHLYNDSDDPLLRKSESEMSEDEKASVKAKKLRFSALQGLGINKENPPRVKIYWYDSEYALIQRFFKAQRESLHTTIWWNNETFDSLYLHSRSLVLEWEKNQTSNRASLAFGLKPSEQTKHINNFKTRGKIYNMPIKTIGGHREKYGHLRQVATPTFDSAHVIKLSAILSDAMAAKYGKDKPSNYKPAHRLELDYMVIFEKFARSRDSKSLKLDVVSKELLGVGKVSFNGKFEDLIKGSTETFFFYGCIDTVTLMLIHLVKKYLNQILISAYTSKVPVYDAFYITRKSSAVFHDLFWCESGLVTASDFEKFKKLEDSIDEDLSEEDVVQESYSNKKPTVKVGYHYTSNIIGQPRRSYKHVLAPSKKTKPFEGAYVVPPRLMKIIYAAFLDMKSLYPSSGRGLGCSKEIFLYNIMERIEGEQNAKEAFDKLWKETYDLGHRISFNNNVYDGAKDGALRTIWSRQTDGRYHAKDLMMNILNFYLPAVEQALGELESEL